MTTSSLPRRAGLISRARQATLNYIAALTINVSLIWGQPASKIVPSPPPIVMTDRKALIDGRWDVREIIPGSPPLILVGDDWDSSDRSANRTQLSLN